MKLLCLLAFFIFVACNSGKQKQEENKDSIKTSDSLVKPVDRPDSTSAKIYANERFREVTVEKVGVNRFRIKGKAQIFEATFSWVVEDGHDEIKNGFQMTDAGAPEWGNFDFIVEVEKKDPASTLHIILFEASAKDGSRQYELPILLY